MDARVRLRMLRLEGEEGCIIEDEDETTAKSREV